jgi:hypothetical protein
MGPYEILNGEVYTGAKDVANDKIFGIGMECNKTNLDDFYKDDNSILPSVDDDERYIYKETLYNCLRFFGLFLAVKFVIYFITHDDIDFTNNIYTR